MAIRLVVAGMQSEVLRYKATKVCSSAAIGPAGLRIVAFIFKVHFCIHNLLLSTDSIPGQNPPLLNRGSTPM